MESLRSFTQAGFAQKPSSGSQGEVADAKSTVQQRAMRHGDIRVTMNYGDAVGEGLREASAKVAAKAIPQ